jgi:hypothetical protein
MEEASAGSMNPGKAALPPIAAGFLRWNATNMERCHFAQQCPLADCEMASNGDERAAGLPRLLARWWTMAAG